jgi:hypothetical protein
MTEIIRLGAHDPVPDYGNHALVLRRMGEDDPNAVVTEIVFYGATPTTTPAVDAKGHPMRLDEAVHAAKAEAERRHLKTLYVVDRTAGHLEREALKQHGSHNFPDKLVDTDEADSVRGSDLRDRPHDAGFAR